MLSTRPLLVFGGRFLLIYGLLIAPWWGLNRAYATLFRLAGNLAFSRPGPRLVVSFEASESASLDSRIVVGNRDLLDTGGVGPVTVLDLDTRSIGLVPVLFLTALILSSNVPWRRKGCALATGVLWISSFTTASVLIWMVSETDAASELALVELSMFWRAAFQSLARILITHFGLSFLAPVLVWVLVTFRDEDLRRMVGGGAR